MELSNREVSSGDQRTNWIGLRAVEHGCLSTEDAVGLHQSRPKIFGSLKQNLVSCQLKILLVMDHLDCWRGLIKCPLRASILAVLKLDQPPGLNICRSVSISVEANMQ